MRTLRNLAPPNVIRTSGTVIVLLVGIMVLSGFNREGDDPSLNCLDCHDDMKAALAERYLHYPFEMKQCDACHDAKTFELTEKAPGLCTVCHRDVRQNQDAVAHSVVDDCASCHSPHASANPKMLLEAIPALCMNCHEPIPQDKKLESVHPPVEAGECVGCHQAHTSQAANLLRQKPIELCAGCHDSGDADFAKAHLSLLAKDSDCLSCHRGHYSTNKALVLENAHPPFAEGMCDSCHDTSSPGASGVKLTEESPRLCLTCHGDIEAVLQSKFPHAAAVDDCLICHGPHATANKSLLLETGEHLCKQCHDETVARQENAVVHAPFGAGQCVECHNPHGSENEGGLVGEQKEICVRCHKDIQEGIEKRQPHTAVTQGCVSCHEPHQGRRKSLLKEEGEALCFRCHDSREKETARFAHYPYREGVCSTCHLPHSGEGVGHLTKETNKLCTVCHKEKHKDFLHPVGVAPSPDFMLKPENRLNFGSNDTISCTTCHFPHTSDNVFLLRLSVTGGDLCYECHQR